MDNKRQLLLKVNGLHNELFLKLKEKNYKDKDILEFYLIAKFENNKLIINLSYIENYLHHVDEGDTSYNITRGIEKRKEYKYNCTSIQESINKLNSVLEKWTNLSNLLSVNKFTCEHIVYTILNSEKETLHMNYLQYTTGLPFDIVKECIDKLSNKKYVYVSKKQWIMITGEGKNKFKQNYPDFLSAQDKENIEYRKKIERERKIEEEKTKRAKEEREKMFSNLFGSFSNPLVEHLKVLGMTYAELNHNKLKSQYRMLCKKYHPDNEFGDEEKFLNIQQSYEYLCKYV